MSVAPAESRLKWLRLSEAIARLMKAQSMSEPDAKLWIVRMAQDCLYGDAKRYAQQDTFRLEGYPVRPTTARGAYEWFRRIGADEFDWEQSTVLAPHPVRIVTAQLIMEVAAAAVEPVAGSRPGSAAPGKCLSRDDAIVELLKQHDPGKTITWPEFIELVADLSNGWVDQKRGDLKRGYGQRHVERIVSELRG